MSKFEVAANAIKESGKQGAKMTDDELLQIYGLFKQATVGDNNTDKPGILDPKGRKKHDAWTANKGKSKEQAEAEYVALAVTLLNKYKVEVPAQLLWFTQWMIYP